MALQQHPRGPDREADLGRFGWINELLTLAMTVPLGNGKDIKKGSWLLEEIIEVGGYFAAVERGFSLIQPSIQTEMAMG